MVLPMLRIAHIPFLVVLIAPNDHLGLLQVLIMVGISVALAVGLYGLFIFDKRYTSTRKKMIMTAFFGSVVFTFTVFVAAMAIVFLRIDKFHFQVGYDYLLFLF